MLKETLEIKVREKITLRAKCPKHPAFGGDPGAVKGNCATCLRIVAAAVELREIRGAVASHVDAIQAQRERLEELAQSFAAREGQG